MLTIVVRLRIKPGMDDEYAELARRITHATHVEDKGCIAYAYFRDVDNPRDFVVYEQWEDREALESHGAQLHRNHGPPNPGGRVPASIERFFETNETHFYEVVADR